MKKRLLLLVMTCFMFSAMLAWNPKAAHADVMGSVSNGTLTISGSGAMADFDSTNTAPWYANRSSITKVVINSGVTTIGDYAFKDLSNLTSITIANTVKSIGKEAFWNCTSLKAISIPDSVTEIKAYAFEASGLAYVTIHDTVTTMGFGVFYNCQSLRGCDFTYKITSIPALTFYNCTSLESFYIPKSVKTIGDKAFLKCSSLKEVTIKPNVTSIGKEAFSGCSALKNVYFVCNPPTIDSTAFTGVTATCTYIKEAKNPLWVEGKRLNYGGSLTWKGDYLYFGPSPELNTVTYVYDGNLKLPGITIKSGDYVHEYGIDYTMSYKNNVKAGTATATIQTKGVWGTADSFSRTFTINKANTTMTVSPSSLGGYPGRSSEIKCTPAKTDATFSYTYATANASIANVDSTGKVTYNNPGTTQITVTCKSDNYNDIVQTLNATTYKPTTITSADVTLAYSSTTYDGTAKKPAVTIKVGNTTYSSDYYTVSYSNNTDAGTASVKVTGRYMLTGTVTKTFTINKASQPTIYYTNNGASTVQLAPGMSFDFSVYGYKGTCTYKSSNTSVFTVSTEGKVVAVGTGEATLTWEINGGTNYLNTTLTQNIKVIARTSLATAAQSCTMSATSFIYDGSAKKPTVTLYVGGKLLVQGTDYDLTYTNNTNAGKATMTIKGINLYSGTASREFEIMRADQVLNASLSANSLTVGKTCTIKVPGLKTTATYSSSNTSVATISGTTVTAKGYGTTTIKVTAASSTNYNGATAEMTLTVAQTFTSISSGTLTLSASSYTYDGSAKQPGVTVVVGGKTLTNGVDYVATYTNNVNAGTATVTINGAGSYNGTLTKTFTISKAGQTVNATISKSSLVPGESASISASALTALSYTSSNTAVATVNATGTVTAVGVGTADITVTAASNTNYNSATKKLTITVKKDIVDIKNCTITLAKESYVYNGSQQNPAVTVKDGSTTLVKDTDYTVTYSNNINAGTATVRVAGKGNYTGSVDKTYTITKASQTLTVSCDATSLEIGGSATITATGVGTITFTSNNTAVATVMATASNKATVKAVAAGDVSITVTAAGDANRNSATEFVNLKVNKTVKNLADCTIKLGQTSFTYNGTERLPSVTVLDGTEVLTQGQDYTVLYENQINAGTATVTIAGKGNYTGLVTRNYTIKPQTATVSFGSESVTYANGASPFSMPAKSNFPDDVQYTSSNNKVATVDNSGRVTIVGMGSTLITAEIKEDADFANRTGAKAQCIVYVKPKQVKGLKVANADTGVQLNWTSISKVAGYQVYRKKGSGSYSKIATVTTNKYLDTTAANGSTYTYKVRAYYKAVDPNGEIATKTLYGSYSSTVSNTYLKRPAISSLTNVTKLSMNVKWAKNASASGYQIQYSTSSSFSSPKTVTVTGASTVSKKISSLTKGKTYYVRLRVYKTVSGTKVYSTYSAKKSVKISK